MKRIIISGKGLDDVLAKLNSKIGEGTLYLEKNTGRCYYGIISGAEKFSSDYFLMYKLEKLGCYVAGVTEFKNKFLDNRVVDIDEENAREAGVYEQLKMALEQKRLEEQEIVRQERVDIGG